MTTRLDPRRGQAPPRQLRDGILLVLLGIAVAVWLLRTDTATTSSLGFAIAGWGLLLIGDAVRPRSRRRT